MFLGVHYGPASSFPLPDMILLHIVSFLFHLSGRSVKCKTVNWFCFLYVGLLLYYFFLFASFLCT
jgi:hypothetical protein